MVVLGEVEFTIVPDIITSLKILVLIITTDKLQVSHSPLCGDCLIYREILLNRISSLVIIVCEGDTTCSERIIYFVNITADSSCINGYGAF